MKSEGLLVLAGGVFLGVIAIRGTWRQMFPWLASSSSGLSAIQTSGLGNVDTQGRPTPGAPTGDVPVNGKCPPGLINVNGKCVLGVGVPGK